MSMIIRQLGVMAQEFVSSVGHRLASIALGSYPEHALIIQRTVVPISSGTVGQFSVQGNVTDMLPSVQCGGNIYRKVLSQALDGLTLVNVDTLPAFDWTVVAFGASPESDGCDLDLRVGGTKVTIPTSGLQIAFNGRVQFGVGSGTLSYVYFHVKHTNKVPIRVDDQWDKSAWFVHHNMYTTNTAKVARRVKDSETGLLHMSADVVAGPERYETLRVLIPGDFEPGQEGILLRMNVGYKCPYLESDVEPPLKPDALILDMPSDGVSGITLLVRVRAGQTFVDVGTAQYYGLEN